MLPAATLCLTFGNRPDLLRQTLESLSPYGRFAAVLGVNDFGDEASNAIFRAFFPQGEIVQSPAKRMQHVAIDAMYARVRTPLIMHCEDDWRFEPVEPVGPAFEILKPDASFSIVSFVNAEHAGFARKRVGAAGYFEPDASFPGYTLQPALLWRATWEKHGPYARFTSEGKIGQHMKSAGLRVAYVDPGLCHHIGEGQSVAHVRGAARIRRNILTRLKRWSILMRQFFGAARS